ncbi:hypothetical protein JCM19037_936 [Geomicrobium sp. JCM 19037]|uniref:ASCH domain-containing protein n=1 Tax=Geomicrobium sp. JCM 19037 TaxID=1460634 RepID=UPI00045F414F|nr:ASCH domain-containing protein [Geomicrobium sp. JCM 19037]GAK02685.1 hypothetical protein JCM19037_936 [Geomicrobium sp. JCM 19037]
MERVSEAKPECPEHAPEAWSFGSGADMADELLGLVLAGKKTATCSLHVLYEIDDEAIPEVGGYNIILNGAGEPQAITRQTSVEIIPFNEVDEEFARAEGEGDLSYSYWHDGHVRYFSELLETYGRTFDPTMLIVCERFELCMTR